MDGILTQKPFPEEYAGHYSHYVDLVPEGPVLDIFDRQSALTHEFFSSIPESLGDHTYAFGKWTIKDIVGHLIDTERIFSTRALRIARGDKQPLPGFEQDDYVKNGFFFKRSLIDIVEERQMLRLANIKMFNSFEEMCFLEKGMVNDNPISVRGIIYLLLGHEIYHIKFIKENYL
ncbi:MAG: DinB family protein [Bacteroidetes bacterium]|nr:DinB family protein [Bacteroidota bacterium]